MSIPYEALLVLVMAFVGGFAGAGVAWWLERRYHRPTIRLPPDPPE